MSQPITWQNVGGPAPGLAVQPLDTAARLGNSAFDNFTKIIQQRQTTDAANVVAGDNVNKQNYLNLLQSAKTPEEVAALHASGRLEAARSILGAASQDATRGAEEARDTSLQQQITARNAFSEGQVTYRDRPVIEQHAALVAAGKITGPGSAEEFRANNPGVRNWAPSVQAAYDTGRARVSNAQADVLAAIKSPNDIATEKFKALVRPQTEELAKGALTLQGTQQGIAQINADDAKEDQLIGNVALQKGQEWKNQRLADRAKVADFVTKLGIRVGENGLPDVSGMGAPARAMLDGHLRDAGLPDTKSLTTGDTNASVGFAGDALKLPGISAGGIARNGARIDAAFNSVLNGAPVGNDALAVATRQAQADVVQKEKDGRNRFAPGSADALTAYEQLATTIPGLVPDDAKEDLPAIQGLIAELGTKGIEVRKGVFVTPSVQDILGEVRKYSKWNFLNSTQANDIKANLKKTMEGMDVNQHLRDREESLQANRARDVRNILNPLTPAMAPLNPLNLPPPAPPPKR